MEHMKANMEEMAESRKPAETASVLKQELAEQFGNALKEEEKSRAMPRESESASSRSSRWSQAGMETWELSLPVSSTARTAAGRDALHGWTKTRRSISALSGR